MKTQQEGIHPPVAQGERPQKKPSLPTLGSQTSGCQNCKKIHFFCFSHTICDLCYCNPIILIHPVWQIWADQKLNLWNNVKHKFGIKCNILAWPKILIECPHLKIPRTTEDSKRHGCFTQTFFVFIHTYPFPDSMLSKIYTVMAKFWQFPAYPRDKCLNIWERPGA